MAGIRYRACEFDADLGAAVQDYQSYVISRHETVRSNISTVLNTVANNFRDLDDLEDVLLAALGNFGITSRAALRQRYGMYELPQTQEERELWLLEQVNTVVVDGQYLMKDPGGIDLTSYTTLHSYVGDAISSLISSGRPFHIHAKYQGVTYTDVNLNKVAEDLGISVSEFDSILFAWNGNVNSGLRNLIIEKGIPGAALYGVMSGQSRNGVEVVVIPRVDLIQKLRSMGLSDSGVYKLFSRGVSKVTIDSQEIREGDSEDTLPGAFLSTPYPGETARALTAEIRMYPGVGGRLNSGVEVYLAPILVLARAIDLSQTFASQDVMARTSTKIGADAQVGQAALAAQEVQFTQMTQTFGAFQQSADFFIEQAALAEETAAFFGVGADCGRNSGTGGFGDFDFWGTVLSDLQSQSIDNLVKEWKDVATNINFGGDLINDLSFNMVSLSCEAVSLNCQGQNNLEDLGAEGGPYDTDGGTNMALEDVSDVLKSTERMLEAFQQIGPNLSLASIGLGQLESLTTEPCESPANISFLQSIRGNGTLG